MANENRCPKCGSPKEFFEISPEEESFPMPGFFCPLPPKDCRIQELSAILADEKRIYAEWYGKAGEDGAPATWDALVAERDEALAESEAKVKELEAKLAECCYVIRSMTSRAVLDGFESPDELEAWMKEIFNTGYKWLESNRDLVKKDEEARKKGAEHGDS